MTDTVPSRGLDQPIVRYTMTCMARRGIAIAALAFVCLAGPSNAFGLDFKGVPGLVCSDEDEATAIQMVKLAEVLFERTPTSAVTPGALERELLELGSGYVAPLVEVFACGTLPGLGEQPELSEVQESAILSVLGRLGRTGALRAIRALAAPTQERPNPIALLRLLGSVGSLGDVSLAVSLAETSASSNDPSPELFHALRCCLERILARNGGLARFSVVTILRQDLQVQSVFVDVISRFMNSGGFEALCELLGNQDGLDRLVLSRLAQNSQRLTVAPSDESLEQLRMVLWSDEPGELALAAQILVNLEDGQAAERMTELLLHPDRTVVAACEYGLEHMSGNDFRGNHERWRVWVAAEGAWYESRFPELLDTLLASDGFPASTHQAIVELSVHRLHRVAITQALIREFHTSTANVRAGMCEALGRLGSRVAIPTLLGCLRDSEDAVKLAAWKALREVTHVELPMDFETWKHALSPIAS